MALKTIQKTKKQQEAEDMLRELRMKHCKECDDIVPLAEWDGRYNQCRQCVDWNKHLDTIVPQDEITSVYKGIIKVMISYSYCTNKMMVMVGDSDSEPSVVLEGSYEDVYERLQWVLIDLGLGDYEWE